MEGGEATEDLDENREANGLARRDATGALWRVDGGAGTLDMGLSGNTSEER